MGTGNGVKRRRTRGDADKANDLFSTFTINKDRECSKYLPYDEVVYPRLFNRPKPDVGVVDAKALASSELHSMWLVANIEHARRHQRELLVKNLQSFLCLPGANILPGSSTSLATLSALGGSGSASGANFADDSVAPGAAAESSTKGSTSSLSATEKLKLRELERRLELAAQSKSARQLDKDSGINAYKSANRKIRKVLHGGGSKLAKQAAKAAKSMAGSGGQSSKVLSLPVSLQAPQLLSLFEKGRREKLAARVLQKWWKRWLIRSNFRYMAKQGRLIKRIQALARGVICRRRIAEWYTHREKMIIRWQSLIRRGLSNRRLRRQREAESKAATVIQSFVRGRQCRHYLRRQRSELAATDIQRIWRGAVARMKTDRKWLDAKVIIMQRCSRGLLAAKRVTFRRRLYNTSARTIQKYFRGSCARKAFAKVAKIREEERREEWLQVLAAQENWAMAHRDVLARRLKRMKLEPSLELALKGEKEGQLKVAGYSESATELKLQFLLLDPEALQQGWLDELQNNIAQHRKWITESKLNTLFGPGLEARGLEEELTIRKAALKDLAVTAERLSLWRDLERKEMWDAAAVERAKAKEIEARKRIADEKRKWAVQFFNAEGKPDRLKRRARRGDSVMNETSEALHSVFCGGNVQLFPEIQSLEAPSNKPSDGVKMDRPGLRLVMEQLKLEAHMAQIAQFENVLEPVEEALRKHPLGAMALRPEGPEDSPEDTPNQSMPNHELVLAGSSDSWESRGKTYLPITYEESEESGVFPLRGAQTVSPLSLPQPPTQIPQTSTSTWKTASPSPSPPRAHGATRKNKTVKFQTLKSGGAMVQTLTSMSNTVSGEGMQQTTALAQFDAAIAASAERGSSSRRRPFAASGFADRHGVASSVPEGAPPAPTPQSARPIGGTLEQNTRARQRQRALHTISTRGGATGDPKDADSKPGCVWSLLDELEAEKEKLRLAKLTYSTFGRR